MEGTKPLLKAALAEAVELLIDLGNHDTADTYNFSEFLDLLARLSYPLCSTRQYL